MSAQVNCFTRIGCLPAKLRTMYSHCPVCRSGFQAEPLYHLPEVPVQSVRLIDKAESARQFPRAPITLLACPVCGLLFNHEFQKQTQHWDIEYEETQACSDHFNRFSEELVEQLVERFGLEQKRILEVGCGKGHFLAALCREGRNTGLGVDPAFDPARNPSNHASVTFLQEVFKPEHLDFEPDLIVCRHTLEHIADPENLVAMMSRRPGCDLFIEVPDLGRILDEGAFWDIYYEHCNYFDEGSMSIMLDRRGIEDIESSLCFHDQYLLASGRTGNDRSETAGLQCSQEKAGRIRQSVSAWCEQLDYWHSKNEKVVLWGGGSKAVAFLSGVGQLANSIIAAVDINPRKQGCFLPGSGHPVLAPGELHRIQPDHIVIMNPAYRSEIAVQLAQMGIKTQLVDVNRPPASDRAP